MSNNSKIYTSADFFSENYRLSCTIDARKNSLGDILYDMTTSYLMVDDAYVSPIDRPSQILIDSPSAMIIKDSLTFALTSDKNTVFRRDQKYGQYYAPSLHEVILTLPFFEISGDLHMPGRVTPEILITSKTEGFITLLDVTAKVVSNPDITYQGEACIVSKNKISFVGLMDNYSQGCVTQEIFFAKCPRGVKMASILVIDDNYDMLEMLRIALSHRGGHEVFLSTSGQEGQIGRAHV